MADFCAADRARYAVDDLDRTVLAALVVDGRLPVAELARRLGLAESTCAARIRRLREAGVIRGVHADVDPTAFGHTMEAMVALRFHAHAKEAVDAFRRRVAHIPGVVAAYHVAGATDFLVHLSAGSPAQLRDLVLGHLTSVEGATQVETSLIFERIQGRSLPERGSAHARSPARPG